ncbi:glycosyltransferase [Catalinimonas locisalis]|uniref:glycosyltransferase n=1 Tax=Catalinimonas locisalis TaxID=3133978 RepID=UPI0031018D53
MSKLKYKFNQLKKIGIRPLLVVNTDTEEKYRKLLGIPGFKSSAYVFVDENNYVLQKNAKQYDAVYAAQLKDFKRISLAAGIERLYIMTYKSGAKQWDLHQEYPEMKHAFFNSKWINEKEKSMLYSQSEVGLCLSKEEGPMLASLEYLLSGLPVVSTSSKGGRDQYYENDFCQLVADNPDAVKKGVESIIKRAIDPNEIREITISKLQKDRSKYVNFMCDMVSKYYNIQLEEESLMKKWFTKPADNFVKLKDYLG